MPKRLYRVEATDGNGGIAYRRDYQGWDAARSRAETLLHQLEHDEAAQVTIHTSDPVTWPDPPVLWHVGRTVTDA